MLQCLAPVFKCLAVRGPQSELTRLPKAVLRPAAHGRTIEELNCFNPAQCLNDLVNAARASDFSIGR